MVSSERATLIMPKEPRLRNKRPRAKEVHIPSIPLHTPSIPLHTPTPSPPSLLHSYSLTYRALVEIQPDVDYAVGPRDLIEVISSLGYECELVEDDQDVDTMTQKQEEEMRTWWWLLILAVTLGMPVMVYALNLIPLMTLYLIPYTLYLIPYNLITL